MEEELPTLLELTAASALLLLSSKFFYLSPSQKKKSKLAFSTDDQFEPIEQQTECTKKDVISDNETLTAIGETTSYASLLTTNDGPTRAQRSMIMAAATARCHEMKLEVVRKTRSKPHRSSGNWKVTPKCWKPTARTTTGSVSETSCLSSGSSEISSGRSQHGRRKPDIVGEEKKNYRVARSSHIRRRAEEILELLSSGGSSEVRIRQLLGDSPDTSKALRMLLKMEEVIRTGAGGRSDPYLYVIAAETSTSTATCI